MDDPRPYYHEFAWAYDLLQTDPVGPRIDFVQAALSREGIGLDSAILDAGCGTGRYSFELPRRGYQVCGVDRSPELIAIARNRMADSGGGLDFVIADLLEISFSRLFDAILCRGVLNDFVQESDRSAIFRQFARCLRVGGILIFDVREWTRTVERYARNSIYTRNIELPDGTLRFQSETALDHELRRLHIQERFEVERRRLRSATMNYFVMRCWTAEEISERLHTVGFDETASYGTYGDSAWSDRVVVIAHKRRIPTE